MTDRLDLEVESRGIRLAGSLWYPDSEVKSLVLMHPGSGPSTRDNDVYFPPIREKLLDWGHAVAAFDKRGAGQSTGSFFETTIEMQAADASACVDRLVAMMPDVPLGAFGHSQGGWVVFELASTNDRVGFVIANSGPGVGPAEQERYRLMQLADGTTLPPRIGALFDEFVALAARSGDLSEAQSLIADDPHAGPFLSEYLVDGNEAWLLEQALFAHDVAASLARVTVPVLALYGMEDRVVPVESSVVALADLLPAAHVVVLPGGDHRLQTGHPGRFVPGYFEALRAFLDRVSELDEKSRWTLRRAGPAGEDPNLS